MHFSYKTMIKAAEKIELFNVLFPKRDTDVYFHCKNLNYAVYSYNYIIFFSDCQCFEHCSRGRQLNYHFYHHYHDYCFSFIRHNLDKHFFGADRRWRHGCFYFNYNWIPTYTLHFIQRGGQRCGIQTSFR